MLEQENGLIDLPDYENVGETFSNPFPPPASPERGGEGAERDEGRYRVRKKCPCSVIHHLRNDTFYRRSLNYLSNNKYWYISSESGREALVPVPPKRTVKRNIPKLDAQRLTSERGLPALRHVFDKAKFKGKGHEAEDLKTLIRHMEHWAHRLFPKLQFEDFIDRIEYLGNKKEVQTCLKRIRLDLPILHEDFISNNDEVGENNDRDTTATELDPFLTNSPESEKFASESSRSLTEEQQQRIERNKQLALERRQAKLLSNSQSLGNDLLANTPGAQTAEDGHMDEDEQEEESDGFNTDVLDNLHDAAAAANTVSEEQELKIEKTQLDQSF